MKRDIIMERVVDNRKIFQEKEWKIIVKNKELIRKVYILGMCDENIRKK